jgi:hypothetical protein
MVFFGGNHDHAVTHAVKKTHVPDSIIKPVEQAVGQSDWATSHVAAAGRDGGHEDVVRVG